MKIKTLSHILLKRLLDLGILFYLILIPAVLITGGFKTEILGISIKVSHLYTPLKILFPLIFIRLLISTKIKDFLLLLISISISLAGAELAVRIINPPSSKPEMVQLHRASPVLGWELVPGSYGVGIMGESYRINKAGFRDVDYGMEKKPGTYRIMVIGDSFTFGARVNLESTYPKQLEKILKSTMPYCEVINCGVIGHNMWQHFEMLKNRVLPYNPDLVILGLFQDDLGASIHPGLKDKDFKGINPFEKKKKFTTLTHSALFNFVRHAIALFENKYRYRRGYDFLKGIEERKKIWGPENPNDFNYKIMSGNAGAKIYNDFFNLLKRFVISAENAGTKVLVAMIPDAVQLNDPHMQFVNKRVKEMCKEIGVAFIDITPTLESQHNPGSFYLFPFDAHNNPKGLKLIAESIADRIIKLGFLPL